MTSYHLGIYMGHDTGAAIVDDDLNIIHVFEEERFDGEKMTYYNPYFSLKHIIELGIRYFKTVSFGFNPDERQAKFHKEFVKFQNVRCAEVLNYLSHHITWDKVCYVDHHTCHAASAFYPSGFRNAAIFVADGSGESEATSFYLGEGNSISRVSSELTTDFSLGILYQYFTEWLGYRSGNTSQHCGKIMGLSSYGRPIYKERIRSMLDIKGDSVIWPEGSLVKMWRGIVAEFGVPQQRPTRHYTRLQADVAASLQQLLEELVIEKLERISGNGRFENLCLAGGVAMNSLLNYRILRSGICENLFVQPLASDRGIALGAALESAAKAVDAHKNAVRAPLWNTYFGYEEKPLQTSLDKLLDKYNLPVYIDKAEISAKEIARLLDENQILALFQGRQEIGPRALGNRSIIAAPTIESRDKTNGQVKYREAWRPFAPTVLEEEVGNYFDINRPEPFMTVIYGVLPQKTGGIEGITHVDGTARLQTIRVDQNPLYYSIIKEYRKLTGTPMILNTSFNINGQPIVRTIYDAVLTFLCSGIDGLLIGNTLIRKTGNLPRENINRLDRVLSEITRDAKSVVLKVLDFSSETETLLEKFLDCACIKYRRDFGEERISKCYINGYDKRSWNIVSRIAAFIEKLVYDEKGGVEIGEDEICIFVTGDKLVEASSGPTRAYLGFDREVYRDLIEEYFRRENRDGYFILDREYHLFDIEYLHSRFEASAEKIVGGIAAKPASSEPHLEEDTKLLSSIFSEDPENDDERESRELYEALSDV